MELGDYVNYVETVRERKRKKKKVLVPGYKIGRKWSWNHEEILPPWPARRLLQYRGQFQVGSERQKEREGGDSIQDRLFSAACLKEPRSFGLEKRRPSGPSTVVLLAFSISRRENPGIQGSWEYFPGSHWTTALGSCLWSSVTRKSWRLDSSSPLWMWRMELEIFWGLVRRVEGVTLVTLESCLSPLPGFRSSSNYRGSTLFRWVFNLDPGKWLTMKETLIQSFRLWVEGPTGNVHATVMPESL